MIKWICPGCKESRDLVRVPRDEGFCLRCGQINRYKDKPIHVRICGRCGDEKVVSKKHAVKAENCRKCNDILRWEDYIPKEKVIKPKRAKKVKVKKILKVKKSKAELSRKSEELQIKKLQEQNRRHRENLANIKPRKVIPQSKTDEDMISTWLKANKVTRYKEEL